VTAWLAARNPQAPTAVFNLRLRMPPHISRRIVDQMIRDYLAACRRGASGPYRIDPKTRRFELVFDSPDLATAMAELCTPPDGDEVEINFADPETAMTTQLAGEEVLLGAMAKLPIENCRHDVSSKSRAGLSFRMDELHATARRMDTIDREAGNESQDWQGRLKAVLLLAPSADGLTEQRELRLEGLRHVIGLPGVGKTTLFTVLAVHLGSQGIRVLLLFPTIEVARVYKETIERYGVKVGMLVGQSDTTRIRHAHRIAEVIAGNGNRGFGETLRGASDFALSCMLPAFALHESDTERWARDFPTYAPCQAVWNTGKRRPKGPSWCPLWRACGRHHAARSLASSDVWVGHVISTDTSVPLPLIGQKMRYFELVGRTFDLVVFDEADAVQALLDQHGIEQMVLNGDRGSLHDKIVEHVFKPRAGGESGHLATASHERMRCFTEFHLQSESLITVVMSNLGVLRHDFANKLLTAYSVIARLMENTDVEHQVLIDISQFWENAARLGFSDRTGLHEKKPDDWPSDAHLRTFLTHHADTVDVVLSEGDELTSNENTIERRMAKVRAALVRRFRDYLNETTNEGRDVITERIIKLIASIMFPGGRGRPDHLLEKMKMLIGVTFQIIAFQQITAMLRGMVEEGSLSPSEFALASSASQDLRRFVPTSILSLLSGIRFTVSEDRAGRQTSKVEYLMFTSAARMLVYRMHRLLEACGMSGPAVIAASATSFLEPSPTHHVPVGPHYVLTFRANEKELGAVPGQSRYRFLPLRDGADGGRPIRYSGAPHGMREDNLRRMIDVLLDGGLDSQLYRAINTFDVREDGGRRYRRKAAFVVNSYEHVRLLKRHIDKRHKDVAPHVRAIVRKLEKVDDAPFCMTPAQAERLGDDEDCDVIIFPMTALGRGTNIVFGKRHPREHEAAIGTVYFLTRPHPTEDDTGFLVNLIGQASMRFDSHCFPATATVEEVLGEWEKQRGAARALAMKLLHEPFRLKMLHRDLYEPFVAQQMVMILQTIGRAMRKNRPAQVYFVDAAWAPKSAMTGEDPEAAADSEADSMLLKMRSLLEGCCNHPNYLYAQIYQRLFMPFLEPFRALSGVNLGRTTGYGDSPENDSASYEGFDL
jgi:hypothetical protein